MNSNKPSCTKGNPPTEADKGKVWVYWDGDTPHYIRADSLKEAWVEMFPRLSPIRWAEIINEEEQIHFNGILSVCWEANSACGKGIAISECETCRRWRPDSWMEEK